MKNRRLNANNTCAAICAIAGLLLPVVAGCGTAPAQTPADEPGVSRSQAASQAATEGDAGSGNAWPCWRGLGGRATIPHPRLADPWPKSAPAPMWTVDLGAGWSSPIVLDDRVFVTERREGTEHLVAVDANTGKRLWETSNSVDFDPHAVGRRHGNGPKSTATAGGGRVFSLGIAGWLQAVDITTGKVAWHINLPDKFGQHVALPQGRAYVDGTDQVIVPIGKGQGAPVPLFGYTGSLLLADNLVVLSVGGANGGTIMAFDASSGREVWRALEEHVSYSSPMLANFGGIRQVVVMTGPRVVGLALADGRLLWSYPFQVQYDESISTPAIGERHVLVTGDGHPLTALELPESGLSSDAPFEPRVAWRSRELSSYLSSMLIHAGHVYGMGDGGNFACLRLSDGKTVWSEGNHGTYCSPILAGNRLLGLNEDGEIAVLAASPQGFQLLGLSDFAQAQTWTMPAVVGSRIYIRSAKGLAAFELGQ